MLSAVMLEPYNCTPCGFLYLALSENNHVCICGNSVRTTPGIVLQAFGPPM